MIKSKLKGERENGHVSARNKTIYFEKSSGEQLMCVPSASATID
jgi:hypothetical protein